jgi:hypothetical protein
VGVGRNDADEALEGAGETAACKHPEVDGTRQTRGGWDCERVVSVNAGIAGL